MTSQSDDMLRVEMRIKNARLYNAIVSHDLPVLKGTTPASRASAEKGRVNGFCEFYGIDTRIVYQLLNLRVSPYTEKLALKRIPQTLCALLEVEPEWLFPPQMYADAILEIARPIVKTVSAGDTARLLDAVADQLRSARLSLTASTTPDAECSLDQHALSSEIDDVLSTLNPRQVQVLRSRFGLGEGREETTLRDVGEAMGITGARVRDIELVALRKLRHPRRSKRLRPYLDI